MGRRSVPEVSSLQLFATTVPSTSTYGPTSCGKRVGGRARVVAEPRRVGARQAGPRGELAAEVVGAREAAELAAHEGLRGDEHVAEIHAAGVVDAHERAVDAVASTLRPCTSAAPRARRSGSRHRTQPDAGAVRARDRRTARQVAGCPRRCRPARIWSETQVEVPGTHSAHTPSMQPIGHPKAAEDAARADAGRRGDRRSPFVPSTHDARPPVSRDRPAAERRPGPPVPPKPRLARGADCPPPPAAGRHRHPGRRRVPCARSRARRGPFGRSRRTRARRATTPGAGSNRRGGALSARPAQYNARPERRADNRLAPAPVRRPTMSVLVVTLALALSAADAARAAAAAAVPSLLAPPRKPPPPADRSYELHRAKDGTGDLVYEAPGFQARIARDGTPRFVDKHFSLLAAVVVPALRADAVAARPAVAAEHVRGPARAPEGPARLAPRPPIRRPSPCRSCRSMSPYRPDPKEACTYPRACFFQAAVVIVGVSGTFDLTDELMRLAGEDPVPAREGALPRGDEQSARRPRGARARRERPPRAARAARAARGDRVRRDAARCASGARPSRRCARRSTATRPPRARPPRRSRASSRRASTATAPCVARRSRPTSPAGARRPRGRRCAQTVSKPQRSRIGCDIDPAWMVRPSWPSLTASSQRAATSAR